MMKSSKYFIHTPDSVKDIANEFKNSLKSKTKLNWKINLKKADEKSSDVDLVFFPVVSRTGTDIDAALSKIEHSKPVILVVLHHTFDPEVVVSNSSTFVTREKTCTVDCLFYEDKGLLKCERNDKAFEDVIKWLELMIQELKYTIHFDKHSNNNILRNGQGKKKVVKKKDPVPNPDKLPVQLLHGCTGKRNSG